MDCPAMAAANTAFDALQQAMLKTGQREAVSWNAMADLWRCPCKPILKPNN
jgi:hypothetical protein